MVEINIRASQGISQAIAEKLNLQGTRISKNIWEQVIGLVEAQNQNDDKIFGKNYGHDISGSGKSNFVVREGKIAIDDNIWNRICRILGKPDACVEAKTPVVDTDAAVKNTTVRAKAFTRITNAIKNNQLGELPTGFREALIKAYGAVDDIDSETTEADYVRSLLLEIQKILGKTSNISEDMARRAMEYTIKICPDGELDGKACSEYTKEEVNHWIKLASGQNINNAESTQGIQEESGSEVQNLHNNQVENVINNIRANIDKIALPDGINKDMFLEKLNTANIDWILQNFSDGRFKIPENPSDADITAAILSDVMGMHDDKNTRVIKSDITIRKAAVDSVLNLYSDDMLLRGTPISKIKQTAAQHQKVITDAQTYIIDNFESSGLDKQFSAKDWELFKSCLNSVQLDLESSGNGRGEDGVFVIETNDDDIDNWGKSAKTRMIKLLIHETYHNYLDKKGLHQGKPTLQEEATCEMLALLTTANMINNDSRLEDFYDNGIGTTVSESHSKNEIANNSEFRNWLQGYLDRNEAIGDLDSSIREALKNILL